MQLILSLDTNTKPFSMKSVARLTYDQATKKFMRVSAASGPDSLYRAKGGGGQGGGQGDGNELRNRKNRGSIFGRALPLPKKPWTVPLFCTIEHVHYSRRIHRA